jgi:hypothetical protein
MIILRRLTAAAQVSKPTSSAASRPGRFGGIGYTAGLEIYTANTKSVAQPQDGYFAHMEKCVD